MTIFGKSARGSTNTRSCSICVIKLSMEQRQDEQRLYGVVQRIVDNQDVDEL